jgi:glycosyltransferase involved in cell wall biosynthesis
MTVQFRPDASVTPRISVVLSALGAGGAERVVSILANKWAARGYRVTILTMEEESATPYYRFDDRISIRRLGLPAEGSMTSLVAVANVLRRVARLRSELAKGEPDVILSFLTRPNILTLLATRGRNIPVIISERNNPQQQIAPPVWASLRRWLYPKAYCLVTITRGALDTFPASVRHRGWVIPNPVELPEGCCARRGTKVLTAVGRLVPQKGFDLLLSAFAQLAARFPDWTLTIWGDGPERERLKQQRDGLGLGSRVTFAGISASPGRWIETADVFVLSSRYEGWGNVLMEAMAAGLPVVSFDCPWGPREMIEHDVNGILVANGNVTALVSALSQVMGDDALRARLSARAPLTARQFEPAKILAEWDRLIARAVGSEHSAYRFAGAL